MKQKIIIILILLFGLLLAGEDLLAAGDNINPIQASTFGELFDSVMGAIFYAASIVAPAAIILGGFFMLFAGPDASKIALGKKIILYTVIIFAIIVIIRALAYFFRGDLTLS